MNHGYINSLVKITTITRMLRFFLMTTKQKSSIHGSVTCTSGPKRQEFPLTFQLTGNNCSAFAHDAFAKA